MSDEMSIGVVLKDLRMENESLKQQLDVARRELLATRRKDEALRSALLVVLDQVDYTSGACGLTEMVGAVLPNGIIKKAREALSEDKK